MGSFKADLYEERLSKLDDGKSIAKQYTELKQISCTELTNKQ